MNAPGSPKPKSRATPAFLAAVPSSPSGGVRRMCTAGALSWAPTRLGSVSAPRLWTPRLEPGSPQFGPVPSPCTAGSLAGRKVEAHEAESLHLVPSSAPSSPKQLHTVMTPNTSNASAPCSIVGLSLQVGAAVGCGGAIPPSLQGAATAEPVALMKTRARSCALL